jgi:AhpD family alkylhydroperoxidase
MTIRSTTVRYDYYGKSQEAMKVMNNLNHYGRNNGLEESLLELVKTRASQLNGCAYCLDLHTKDARAAGETEQRLYALSAWRESPFYTERERAALAFTECVTLIAANHVPDEVYATARQHFTEDELVNLVMSIIAINAWNRLSITFGDVVGSYQPRRLAKPA